MAKLCEIYVENDEESFTVGSLVSEAEDLYIVETLDEKGRLDGYQLRPKSQLGKIVSSSEYLEFMEFNQRYNMENALYNPLGLKCNLAEYSNLESAFHHMKNAEDIYTFVLENCEDIYYGYIKSVVENEIVISAIDFEGFTQTEISIDKTKIVAIDILSCENVLLQKFLTQK